MIERNLAKIARIGSLAVAVENFGQFSSDFLVAVLISNNLMSVASSVKTTVREASIFMNVFGALYSLVHKILQVR